MRGRRGRGYSQKRKNLKHNSFSLSHLGWQVVLYSILVLAYSDSTAARERLAKAISQSLFAGQHSITIQIKRELRNFDYYKNVYDANLFHPTRELDINANGSGDSNEKSNKNKDSVKLPNLILIGTLSIGSSRKYAYLIDKNDRSSKNKPKQYEEGDMLGEYLISEIRPDRVILMKESEVAVVKLKPLKGRKRTRRMGKYNNRNSNAPKPGRNSKSYNRNDNRRQDQKKKKEKYSYKKESEKSKYQKGEKFQGQKFFSSSKSRSKTSSGNKFKGVDNQKACGGNNSMRQSDQSYSCGR